jgi:murein DD-endopeptidase MepM/ murein hydrolase activator NlpD
MKESGGNPQAHNPNAGTGDNSYGLFQINMLGNLGPARLKQFGLSSNDELLDPAVNARVAFQMSQGGRNWGPWGVGPDAYRDDSARYQEALAKFPGGSAARATIESGARRRGAPPSIDQYVAMALGKPLKRTRASTQAPVTQPRDVPFYVNQALGKKTAYAKATGRVLNLPLRWKGTHNTDNLTAAGRNTAIDIMADAGTAVTAPFDGTVERWGSAQGGESMYLRAKNGKRYWLGHVADMIPAGSRFRKGSVIAYISSDHAAPHAHWDWLS